MSELLQTTLTELCDRLHRRDASPVELMEATLAQLDATHSALNALVARRETDQLLAEATQAEERITKGDARPLEGVPLGVKDLEDAAGLITSHGSLLFKDHFADSDSTQVARLRAAGAIVVGKTNAPEFGSTAITKNLVYGVTRSPWDTERSPGGSSGGSAALLAAEALPLVTASDGGGSIRIPASFVGAVGLKPSYGRVPKGPGKFWDYGATSVYGPLTKSVADAALVLDQIVGYAGTDHASLPHPGFSYAERLRETPPSGLKIAYSRDLGHAVVHSEVAASVEAAAKAFEKLGHSVTEIDGGPPEMGGDWGILGAYELLSEVSQFLPERRGDIGRSLMTIFDMAKTAVDPSWWNEVSQKRARLVRWCADVFSDYDLLLTPTTPYTAPPARGPFPAETEGTLQRVASVATFTIPFNLSWNPGISLRCGMAKDGLPIGLQLVAPHHCEDRLLSVAAQYEREHDHSGHWPGRG